MARALDALAALERAEGEEGADPAEITVDGRACWIGAGRTSHRVVRALVARMLVTDASDEGGLLRYRLSEAGRAARLRPAIAGEISAALREGRAFAVADGRVVPLSVPEAIPPG
jgi:hypothetical protein